MSEATRNLLAAILAELRRLNDYSERREQTITQYEPPSDIERVLHDIKMERYGKRQG